MEAKHYYQKCWLCKKATNGNLCSWPRKLKMPKGCETDEDGYIIERPNFEIDLDALYTKDVVKIFKDKISTRTIFRYKTKYNLSPKELYIFLTNKLNQEEQNVNANSSK